MPKIDTSKIENYEQMTAEEKLKALEEYELPEADYSGYVEKELYDRTAAELKERLTAHQEMEKELAALRRETLVNANKAKLLALGYEESLAEETAEAILSGDMDRVFDNQKKHLDSFEKRVRGDLLRSTPKPVPDGDSQVITLENLRQMSQIQRLAFAETHAEEYKQLYGGINDAQDL